MCDPTNDPERRTSLNGSTHNKVVENIARKTLPIWDEDCIQDMLTTKSHIVDEDNVVNHPKHYTNRKMEAIDIIEMIIEIEPNTKVAYSMSNVLKYMLRFREKGDPIKDMKKARWYLNRMIKHLEDETLGG